MMYHKRVMNTQDTAGMAVKPNLLQRIFTPTDIDSIALFRFIFGCIITWEVYVYFSHGWIAQHFIDPTFHFKHFGFSWVKPLPGIGMYIVWAGMAVCGVLVAIGLFYRVAAFGLATLWSYMFFVEQTRYLNHFYLIMLVAWIMALIPAHTSYSLDAKWRPSLRSQTIPTWCLWLLRLQIGVVYFFGGIHKTNPDWLRGEPMRTWLPDKADLYPIIGQWFDQEWMVAFFTYGGLLFDLLVVPALLWKPTRMPAFLGAVGFHLFNVRFFNIGIFPWFMIAATLLYFPPSWPKTLLAKIQRMPISPRRDRFPAERESFRHTFSSFSLTNRIVAIVLVAYATLQLTVPLRPYLYPGHILWSEQGMWMSWNMMLSRKRAKLVYVLRDPETDVRWEKYPTEYLTPFQLAVCIRKADMILQLAHHIVEEARKEGYPDVEIYVRSEAQLNGRAWQPYFDPSVNLANKKRSLAPLDWIMKLEEPYPPKNLLDAVWETDSELTEL